MIGTSIGPYQILAELGRGGMGEVYRARDTKLNRDVALKVLPDTFAADPDRLMRFRREAQVLAALNHPNIATIHGFEDAGDTHALVLELVDGATLEDLIAMPGRSKDRPLHSADVADGLLDRRSLGAGGQAGGLTLADALAIAKQIADRSAPGPPLRRRSPQGGS